MQYFDNIYNKKCAFDCHNLNFEGKPHLRQLNSNEWITFVINVPFLSNHTERFGSDTADLWKQITKRNDLKGLCSILVHCVVTLT